MNYYPTIFFMSLSRTRKLKWLHTSSVLSTEIQRCESLCVLCFTGAAVCVEASLRGRSRLLLPSPARVTQAAVCRFSGGPTALPQAGEFGPQSRPSATVKLSDTRSLCRAPSQDSGEVLWSLRRDVPFFSSPNASSGLVVIGSVDGNICCFSSAGELVGADSG